MAIILHSSRSLQVAERAGKKDLWENSELAAAATPIESALLALSHSSRSEAFPIMQRRSFEGVQSY